jgi:hypothetical protein
MDRITLALVTVGLIVLDHTALAQRNLVYMPPEQSKSDDMRPEESKCRHTEGNLVEVYDPEKHTAFGMLRNAGWLDGTTAFTDSSGPFPTADLNKFSFSSAVTLTTAHGQLKGKGLVIFDVMTGIGTSVTEFDGSTNTGIFAGATGVLFVNTFRSDTVAKGPYYSAIYARICFARANEPAER